MLSFENSEAKVNESKALGVVSIFVKSGISRGIMFDGLKQFSDSKKDRLGRLNAQSLNTKV